MAETVEPLAAPLTEDEAEESAMTLLEQLGRDVSALVLCETRLAASRHKPELRRAARDVAAAVVVGLAFLAAFALANAAAVRALSPALSDWAAPLVLAAAWVAIGTVLALFLRARARHVTGWNAEDAEQAREEAEQAVRATLERLSPLVSREIALAAVPMAGDVAGGMAGGVVDAGDAIIEGSDDMVEAMTQGVPGGRVVNQMWDVVLMPGRLGIRVATTVLKR